MTDDEGPTGVIGEDERDIVFVSYARSNGRTIAPLLEELQSRGTRLWIDVEDIRPATEWIHEIKRGITNARAFLALLSPEYLASRVCLEELEFARESGKAIIAVVLGDLKGNDVPAWLAALHWITWEPGTEATAAAAAVTAAASTDVSWSDLHSQLQVRATEWSRRGRTTSDLLRGSELDEAERELAVARPVGQPFPTTLQREYVVSSRAHQRRLTRRVISAVSLVAVMSLLLAGLATWQGVKATRSAEEARQSLAKSDFERFRAAATESPDLVRRARLSLAAHAAAERAGLASASSARPLVEAFEDVVGVPVARFDIRPEDQGYSGDHEGVAVSGDGSALAYLGLDGVLHVVDLWTLDERATFTPTGWPDHILPQIALSFDGTRLMYAAGASDSIGVLREYNVTTASPTVAAEKAIPFGDQLAAVAFGPRPQTYTLVRVSGQILTVELTADEPHVTVLGDETERANAGLMLVTFSHDANRVCLTGDAKVLYQLSPPKLISAGSHLTNCVPEPCAGSVANHIELEPDGDAACLTPGGAAVADFRDCESCTRQARVSDEPGLGYRAVVPGPDGDQTIEWGAGLLSVFRPSDGTVPEHRATAIPDDGTQVWSSNGHRVVVPRPDGNVSVVGDGRAPDRLPAGDLVESLWDSPGQLLSTGDVASVQAGKLEVLGGTSAEAPALVDEGIQVHSWFGDLVALGESSRLEVWDVSARELLYSHDLGSAVCAVGWSLGGTALGAAACSPEGETLVSTWSVADELTQDRAPMAAPLPTVNSISLSDDGAVISISRASGETAVWRDGQWIADAQLNAAASETNDYHAGWSVVDQSGSWFLVRKNREGIVLWSIGEEGVSPAAALLVEDPYTEPVVPEFNDTTLELAWVDPVGGVLKGRLGDGLDGPQVREWDLSAPVLAEPLCMIASAGAVKTDPTGGDATRYGDPCAGWTRDLPDPPAVEAPTVAALPVADAEPYALHLRNYDTLTFGPDFGFESIAQDAASISILHLIGSHRADVDLDDLSVIRSGKVIDGGSFKFGVVDDRTRDLIAAEWCGDTYRFTSTDVTQVKFDDGENFVACNPVAIAADVLWTVRAGGFVGVGAQGVRQEVPLSAAVATGTVEDLINPSPNELLALIAPTSGAPQLVRLDAGAGTVSTKDAEGIVGPLAAGSDGVVWAATKTGVRLLHADGTTKDITFPDLSRVSAMTVDSLGRLWFTTRTTIGLVTSDGRVRFRAVADAQDLSDIAFTDMGSYLAVLDSSRNVLIRFSMSEG